MVRSFLPGRIWPALVLAILAALVVGSWARAEDLSPAVARLKADVAYLADDAREGRGPGTAGIEAAADHIAAAFKEAGLKPAPGAEGYFQPFTIAGTTRLGEGQELAARGPDGTMFEARLKDDFSPLGIGGGGTLDGVPVVFAGHGITAKDGDDKVTYDDYAGLDVKDKAVLILRGAPTQGKDAGPFVTKNGQPSGYATFLHKTTNAFQHGARAVLLANDRESLKKTQDQDELLAFNAAGFARFSNIPVVMVTRAYADRLLAAAKAPTLESLEDRINEEHTPRGRTLEGLTLDAAIRIERQTIPTKNVVGVLDGAGPRAGETVVVGAHYDHLGRGGMGSLSPFSKDIHNGADDNASGTAMVIEMARRLARRPDPLPRRVVFIAFSGEERGLLGSMHYVEHPLFPLDATVAMVNFDMVGRLNERSELTVFGVGSSPGLAEVVEALGKAEGFQVKKVSGLSDGIGGSDHQSFYLKGIPVLFPFTGTHRDYHRPSDDTDAINFAGMARIADLSELLLLDLARRPERPAFAKADRGSKADPGRLAVSVYLGTIPDYNEDIKGIKLNGVREGSPAEKGGLKAGDVIVGFGGKPVETIYDYTEGLGRYKPGDQVEIRVRRDGQETRLTVTLGARPKDEGH